LPFWINPLMNLKGSHYNPALLLQSFGHLGKSKPLLPLSYVKEVGLMLERNLFVFLTVVQIGQQL
jgi:hypothetical protein